MARRSTHARAAPQQASPCACASSGAWRLLLACLVALLALLAVQATANLQQSQLAQQAHLRALFSDEYVWARFDNMSEEEVALLALWETPGFFSSMWTATKSKVQGAVAATAGTVDAAKVRLLDAQIAAARNRRDTAAVNRLTAERNRVAKSYQANQAQRAAAAKTGAAAAANAKAAAKTFVKEVKQGTADLAVAGAAVVKTGVNAYQINSRSDRLAALEKKGQGQSAEAVRLRAEISAAAKNMAANQALTKARMESAKKNIPVVVKTGTSLALGTKGVGDVIVGGVKTGAASLSANAAQNQINALTRAKVGANDPRMIAAKKALASATTKKTAAKAQLKSGVAAVNEHGETMVRTAAMVNPVLAVGVAAYDVGRAGVDAAKHAKNGDYKAAAAAMGRGVFHAATAKIGAGQVGNAVKMAKGAATAEKAALSAAAKKTSAASTQATKKSTNVQKSAAQASAKAGTTQTALATAQRNAQAAAAKAKATPTNANKAALNRANAQLRTAQQNAAKASTNAAKQSTAAANAAKNAAAKQAANAAAQKKLAKAKDPAKINIFNAKGGTTPKNLAQAKALAKTITLRTVAKKSTGIGASAMQSLENKAVASKAAQDQAAKTAAANRLKQQQAALARQRALAAAAKQKQRRRRVL